MVGRDGINEMYDAHMVGRDGINEMYDALDVDGDGALKKFRKNLFLDF